MKILIVTATAGEVAPLLAMCRNAWDVSGDQTFTKGDVVLEFLTTGVGMIRTSYALGKVLGENKPDLCINAGIAGAFPGKFAIGDVVHVIRDCLPEMGATDADSKHLTMEDLELTEDIDSVNGLVNAEAGSFGFLPKAVGITVNAVHGDKAGIARTQAMHPADIETMESAAFMYCCIKEGVSFIAIRAISNIVEPRDRSKWDIPLAIENLNSELSELLGMFVS